MLKKHDNLIKDNIFLVLGRIKLVRDTFILDTDIELFLGKILDDIEFIHQILEIMYKKLHENERLINREELLNHLAELEWQFSQVLSEIINGQGNISASHNPSIREKLLLFRKNSLERRETLETLEKIDADNQKEPVLSIGELNELLKDL